MVRSPMFFFGFSVLYCTGFPPRPRKNDPTVVVKELLAGWGFDIVFLFDIFLFLFNLFVALKFPLLVRVGDFRSKRS